MARTAPVPNIPPIPGMCPSILVAAGGSDSGGGGGKGAGSGGSGGPGTGGGAADGTGGDQKAAPDPNKFPMCGTESHPVDVVTGRAFTHPILDFELPGPLKLTFQRAYSTTARKREVGIGYGWSHSLAWQIEVRRGALVVWNEQGVSVEFPQVDPGNSVLGPWGWVLRAETWGYALDTTEGKWLLFSERQGDIYKLTAIEDRNRNRITLSYEDGVLVEIVDSVGRSLRVTSDTVGRISAISVLNAASQGRWIALIRYVYDERGNLASATDPDQHSWRYSYDELHRMTEDQDRNGLIFHFRYDQESRCIEAWGDYGDRPDPALAENLPKVLADGETKAKGIHHCVFIYGEGGYTEVVKSTEVRRYFGNKNGTLDKAVVAGGVISQEYDERGHLRSMTDELGARYEFQRDVRGRLIGSKGPLGNRALLERDDAGLVVRFTDALDYVTTISRDSRGNPLVVEHPNGGITSYEYDERGLCTSCVLPEGGRHRFVYDVHGNIVSRTSPDGAVRTATYDYLGQLLGETEGDESWSYTYTERGDVRSVRSPDGLTESYEYDGEGNCIAFINKTGGVTRRAVGGYKLLCQDGSTRFAYDREGNLLYVTNARGEQHRFFYDAGGFCVGSRTFDGRSYSFTNDLVGRLTKVVDGLRRATTLEYDIVGNLVSRELDDGTKEEFVYDLRNEIIGVVGSQWKAKYVRDAMGCVVKEEITDASGTYVLERVMNLEGNPVATKSSLGFDLEQRREGTGGARATILGGQSGAPRELLHLLDSSGRELARTLPLGGEVRSRFDAVGRLLERHALQRGAQIHEPRMGEPDYVGERAGHFSFRRQYQWNALDSLINVVGSAGYARGYEYDEGMHIAAIDRKHDRREYEYDAEGCRLVRGEHTKIGPAGRLLEKGKTTYHWDADGQLVEKRALLDDGIAITRYEWTAKGQLSSVALPDGARVEFDYDPLWRRTEKRVIRRDVVTGRPTLTARTRFHWSDCALTEEVREHFDAGKVVRKTHKRYYFEDCSLVPLAHQDVEGEHEAWFHYVNDQVGMPETLLDDKGDVVASLIRDEWGSARMAEGSRTDTPLRFLGQYADEETGLACHRYRYYDPETSQFISPDPIGIDGGIEPYSYGPDPLSWVDPLGLSTKSMDLGDGLEENRKAALVAKGFRIVETRVGANGIDILAVKGKAPNAEVRIEECKTGSSRLKRMDTPLEEKQMSQRWLRERLEAAHKTATTPPKKSCQEIHDIKASLDAVNNPSSSNLSMAVVHQKIRGDIGPPDTRQRTGNPTLQPIKFKGATNVQKGGAKTTLKRDASDP